MFFFWINYILSLLKKYIKKIIFYNNCLKIDFLNFKDLFLILFFLKKHSFLKFNSLVDIVCIDTLKKSNRFILNYIVLSLKFKKRLILNFDLDYNLIVSSIINIYSGANWMEREIWDLFGIFFLKHIDLRRILTDYGFNGYPFRKDFPLNGFFEIRFDEDKQYIMYEPLELTQNLRFFDFIIPFLKKNL